MKHYNTVISKDEVPTGPSTLGLAFNETGAYRGIGTLYINGKEEGQTPLAHTVPLSIPMRGAWRLAKILRHL